MKYIRFVAGTNRESPRRQHGVVTALRMLRDSGEVADYEAAHIRELFEWMNENLPCPPFKESDWSSDAISWFKDSAQEFISRIRDMIVLLEIHGRPVRTITTLAPGSILYEDDYQVVAESPHY
ncbi:MAG: hypothetical protein EOP83_17220 [Verrucomicrobiaceae bacterium]|nr:MAG: hypothetical protein EOP83_17220 [Verrucomicrobiaceae bacterium]